MACQGNIPKAIVVFNDVSARRCTYLTYRKTYQMIAFVNNKISNEWTGQVTFRYSTTNLWHIYLKYISIQPDLMVEFPRCSEFTWHESFDTLLNIFGILNQIITEIILLRIWAEWRPTRDKGVEVTNTEPCTACSSCAWLDHHAQNFETSMIENN